jgi:hypothetical protein
MSALRAALVFVVVASCDGTTTTTGSTGTGGSTGDGGADHGAAKTYSCGSDTCMTGQTFCYSYAPGVPGGGVGRSCMTVPAACAKNPTCACLCPPVRPPMNGCTFTGGFGSGSCSCSELNGELEIDCAGA